MLVLTRKIGQSVMVGKDVEVVVVRLNNGRVALGFKASEDIEIDRKEVREAKDTDGRKE